MPVRNELPSRSRAGIECASDDRAVARIGFYLYDRDEDMATAGCFINDQGYANYRVTTGMGVYIGILGRNDDMGALADFAFLGSQDTPAFPTLWGLE